MPFPKAKKIEPLYELPDGFYRRLLEKDAKADPDAMRAEDEIGKVIWVKPLGIAMAPVPQTKQAIGDP